jgi:hypothetical protein
LNRTLEICYLRFPEELEAQHGVQNDRNCRIMVCEQGLQSAQSQISDLQLLSYFTFFWFCCEKIQDFSWKFISWLMKVAEPSPIHENVRNIHIYIQLMKQLIP